MNSPQRALTNRDPRDALAGLGAALAIGGALAARRGVATWESTALLEINTLPDSLYPAVWPVMQLGSLASVGAIASLVYSSGHPKPAGGVAVGGVAAWLICKPMKRLVRRARPGPRDAELRIRGRTQTGLGYPSGHAAVAASMATVLVGERVGGIAGVAAALAGAVALSRVYVGAHYPLDVIGGSAVGLVTGLLGREVAGRA